MKKFELNKQYITIAAYVLLVLLFAVLLLTFFLNVTSIFNSIGAILSKISCLFYGIFFTFCFLPFVKFFENKFSFLSKKKDHKVAISVLSVIVVDLIIVAFIALCIVLIIPNFMKAYDAFQEEITPQYMEYINSINSQDHPLYSKVIEYFTNIVVDTFDMSINGSLVSTVSRVVTKVFSSLYSIALGLVLSAYFLFSRNYLATISNKFFSAIFPQNFRTSVGSILKRIYFYFVEYFSYRLIDGIILFIICYLLFLPFSIPYSIIICVLLFIANFVPVIGPIVSVILSTGFIAIFSTPTNRLLHTLVVAIVMIVLFAISSIFESIFLHKKLRPGPGIVLISVIVFYAFFKIWGLLFAVPLYASFDFMYKDFITKKLVKKKLPLNESYYLELEQFPNDSAESTKIEIKETTNIKESSTLPQENYSDKQIYTTYSAENNSIVLEKQGENDVDVEKQQKMPIPDEE